MLHSCMLQSIRRNKEFGNPYILNIVVDHFKIQETGSNYPKEIFDPCEITAVRLFLLFLVVVVLLLYYAYLHILIACFQSDFENRMKRKRVDSTAAIPPTASAVLAGLQPAGAVPAAVAGPSAAVLAAAVAAINSSMAARAAATTTGTGSSEAEPRRRSKWG